MDLPNFADPFLFDGNLTIDGFLCPVVGLIANFNMALIPNVADLTFIGFVIHRGQMYGVYRLPPVQFNIQQQVILDGQQVQQQNDQDGQQQLVQQQFGELDHVWMGPNVQQAQQEEGVDDNFEDINDWDDVEELF